MYSVEFACQKGFDCLALTMKVPGILILKNKVPFLGLGGIYPSGHCCI